MFRLRLSLLLVLLALLSGCATTNSQTARQLEQGETVVSAAVDMPGFMIIPRVSGQVTYGLGSADLSVHAASSFLLANNLGVGGRYYLSELFLLGLTADVHFYPLGLPFISGPIHFFSVSPRFSTSVTPDRPVYGGAQAFLGINQTDTLAATLGGFMGYESLISDRTGFQIEVAAAPFIAFVDRGFFDANFFPYNVTLTAAVNWRLGVETEARDAPVPTPTEQEQEGFLSEAEPTVRSSERAAPGDQDTAESERSDDGWGHSISREEIRAVIRSQREEFTLCYEAQLHLHPNLAGQITVSFLINDEGRVAQATVERSTMNAPDVESCVLEVIRTLTFPELEPGEEIRVDYPFNFSRI